jgi:DNA ligase (NAD+)
MPSQKLLQILRSKSTLTEEQIGLLSEQEGWQWIYKNFPPNRQRRRATGAAICFTGFRVIEKAEFSSQAAAAGLHVVGSVTKDLVYLCVGDDPGAAKLQKAHAQNVQLLDRLQFLALLETGELP